MFDYKAYFKERTMRDYTVAMVLRMMADNGYMGQHAVGVLSETNAEITSEPFPGEAGLRQLNYMSTLMGNSSSFVSR